MKIRNVFPRTGAAPLLLSFLFFCSILSFPHYSLFAKEETLNEALSPYGASFGSSGKMPVLKNFANTARGRTFHTIIAQKEDTRIEFEIIKPLEKDIAAQHITAKYQIIMNLYGPQTIPYPGAITRKTDCPENKKPVEIKTRLNEKPARVLIANASDRYVFGVWDDALIKQKAAFAVTYDQNTGTLYQIMVFRPAGSFDIKDALDILASFSTVTR